MIGRKEQSNEASLYQKLHQKKTSETENHISTNSCLINDIKRETKIAIEHQNMKAAPPSDQEVKLIHTHDSPELNTSTESNTGIVQDVPIVLLKEKRKRNFIHVPITITSFEAEGHIPDDYGLD